ncbi:MAG: sialate O-acetylesterase, partial [Fimbriimonadaceae bacterium]
MTFGSLAGVLILTAVGQGAASMATKIRLPRVFGDNMVWQRDRRAPVWGTAEPGRRISVRFLDRIATATVRPDGTFRAVLPAISGGGPADMTIDDGTDSLRLRNVVVGDVWLCSGQSNMEWPVSAANNPEAEIAAADFPLIRLFHVARFADPEWTGDVDAQWEVCSPETVGRFSAVAYFMGRSLHRSSGVPIGLIHSSWGGTPAEAWVSREALGASPVLRPILARLDRALAAAQDPAARAAWDASQVGRVGGNLVDPGNKGFDLGFAAAEAPGEWKRVRLPGAMESLAPDLDIDGAVWFRRTVEVPAAWVGRELPLSLGAIDDFDDTYFNGTLVGRTTAAQPGWWQHVRRYAVPAGLVRAGRNVVAVRVFDQTQAGGIVGPADEMSLAPADGSGGSAISLAGFWNYRIEFGRPTPPGGAG